MMYCSLHPSPTIEN
jgi:hypothetical protein